MELIQPADLKVSYQLREPLVLVQEVVAVDRFAIRKQDVPL